MFEMCKSAEPTLCRGRHGSVYPRLICGLASGAILAKKRLYPPPHSLPVVVLDWYAAAPTMMGSYAEQVEMKTTRRATRISGQVDISAWVNGYRGTESVDGMAAETTDLYWIAACIQPQGTRRRR